MPEESISHKTARTSLWAAVEKIATMGVQFVVTLLLARLLTPSDYGAVAMLGVFIAVSNTFINSGFCMALIRKLECTQKDFSTAFYFNVGMAIIIYLGLYVAAPFISDFYNLPILCSILRIYGITLIIESTRLVQNAMLTRRLDFKSTAKISTFSMLVSGVIGIGCAYMSWGPWALVVQSITCSTISLLLTISVLHWVPSLVFSVESMKYLWNFGSKLLASSLLSTFYSNIYSLLIGRFYNSATLGLFNRGQTTAGLAPDIVQGIFLRSSMPIMSQLQNQREDLIRVYSKFCQLGAFISFPAAIALMVLAEPFVLTILTEKWKDAVIYIQIFCVFSMLAPVNVINYNLLLVVGRSDATLKAELIKKIIGIAVVFALIKYGTLVLAVGSTFYSFVIYYVNLYFAKKIVGISIMHQFRDLMPPMTVSILCGVLVYAANQFISNNILQLIAGALIYAILYYVLTRFVFRFELYDNLEGLIKRSCS